MDQPMLLYYETIKVESIYYLTLSQNQKVRGIQIYQLKHCQFSNHNR